jgi:uncharacterized protein (TIGR03067 family)
MKTAITLTIVLLAAAALRGAEAAKETADAALKKLNGTWIIQSIERDPAEKGKDEGKGIRCVVEHGKVTANRPGETKAAGRLTITVDPSTKPMSMTITPEGERQSLAAIYKIEGDQMTVCWKSIEAKRPPAEFSAKPGTGQTVVTLARERPPVEPPAVPPEQKKQVD